MLIIISNLFERERERKRNRPAMGVSGLLWNRVRRRWPAAEVDDGGDWENEKSGQRIWEKIDNFNSFLSWFWTMEISHSKYIYMGYNIGIRNLYYTIWYSEKYIYTWHVLIREFVMEETNWILGEEVFQWIRNYKLYKVVINYGLYFHGHYSLDVLFYVRFFMLLIRIICI